MSERRLMRMAACVAADWSNAKGTGTADGWCKHKPMDDEEMLFKQVQMTAAATPGTTVWVSRHVICCCRLPCVRHRHQRMPLSLLLSKVYRNTVYGYPWYTDVRKTLGRWRSPL